MKRILLLFIMVLFLTPVDAMVKIKPAQSIQGACIHKGKHKSYKHTTHVPRKHWWYFWKGAR